MTLAAVWRVEERVYAIADTRISRSAGNVLTEHGPKLLPVILVCKQPGPAKFFNHVAFATAFGFAYAGATLPALATHALASTLFQNLIGVPGTPPPGLDAVSGGIAEIAQRYMREIGELSGLAGLFSAIVFGFCPGTSRFRAFKLAPAVDSGFLRVITSEHDLYQSDTLLVIGSRPELLEERVRTERCTFLLVKIT